MRLEETVECHGEALNRFVKCRCGEELVIEGIIQSAQNVVEGITERDAFAEAAGIIEEVEKSGESEIVTAEKKKNVYSHVYWRGFVAGACRIRGNLEALVKEK